MTKAQSKAYQVLGLDVSMDDIMIVQIFDAFLNVSILVVKCFVIEDQKTGSYQGRSHHIDYRSFRELRAGGQKSAQRRVETAELLETYLALLAYTRKEFSS